MNSKQVPNDLQQASSDSGRSLDSYYVAVEADILSRQDPVTGLLPASTAVTVHGDYRHAWVRDNVYSVLAVWGLALAYARHGGDPERRDRLEQSTVKLMRGLLVAMMKQADRVERFKQTQDPLDALHAKYDTRSGDAVVGDGDWGHLQIDATGLFVLMLAQMTRSGLRILHDLHEVAFLQNLVHYLAAAWHTPDYGIWERGHKRNQGVRELNASSVGMAKAALEVMQGFNAYGSGGGPQSVIHVPADDVARTRIALQSLLPRESTSKETDAALLSIIGYPAYAVEDPALVERTRAEILDKLEGPYGCKRFLRDGHQTAVEDHHRLHYAEGELRLFQHIESEWPLFFTYLLLDGSLRGDSALAAAYRARLEQLAVTRDGRALLPELYLVPAEHVEWEKLKPGSQPREANENLPLVWAQSLYTLGCLVADGWIEPADLDPLGRRHRIGAVPGARLRVALLAADQTTLELLHEAGLPAALSGADGVELIPEEGLSKALEKLGACSALGLSGQPPRAAADTLLAAQVFSTETRERIAVVAELGGASDSRLLRDAGVRLARLRGWFSYLSRHWSQPGEPLLVLRVQPAAVEGSAGRAFLEGLSVLLRDGIAIGAIRCEALSVLVQDLPTVRLDALDTVAAESASRSPTRVTVARRPRAVGAREIADAVSHIVVHQHRLALGRGQEPGSVIEGPLAAAEVHARVRRFGDPDVRAQALVLDVIALLGVLVQADPSRFAGVLTLRPWHLLDLMADAEPAGLAGLTAVGTGELLARLDQVIRAAASPLPSLLKEPLHSTGEALRQVVFRASDDPAQPEGGWLAWRRRKGVVGNLSQALCASVWELLRRCDGLVVGYAYDQSNRLDSEAVRADMSAFERDFCWRLELLLGRIQAPEYRQISIEALEVLAAIAASNPGLRLAGDLNLDVLIDDAVRLSWMARGEESAREQAASADAWLAFESSPPHEVANSLMEALQRAVADDTRAAVEAA